MFENERLVSAQNNLLNELMEKITKLQEDSASPYICGIPALAKYLGIGETFARELKDSKEFPCYQRGRALWFKKSEVEKFIQKNRV